MVQIRLAKHGKTGEKWLGMLLAISQKVEILPNMILIRRLEGIARYGFGLPVNNVQL